jgi:plasmid maintenance system antidote protein VapI
MASTDSDVALKHLRKFVAQHPTQKAAARALGISEPYLCDLLNGRRLFSTNMLDRLGLERQTTIRRKQQEVA